MNRLRLSVLLLLSITLGTLPVPGAPTASPDSFTAFQEVPINVPVDSGVLANDGNGTDPVKVVLDQDVSNGILSLNADGSFSYQSNGMFTGPDPFTYFVESTAPRQISFTVDQANSSLSTSATLTVPLAGEDSDMDSSTISGTTGASMSPAEVPFDRIQVNQASLVLAQGLNLLFDYSFLGTVAVNAAPDSLQLDLVTPGAETTVNPAGLFTQAGNEVKLSGTVGVSATGFAATLISDTTMSINENSTLDLTDAKIEQLATELRLTVPVSLSITSEVVSGVTLALTTVGEIRATAPLPGAPERSPTVTAAIQVEESPVFEISDVQRTNPDTLTVTISTTPGLTCRLLGSEGLAGWSIVEERVADSTSEIFTVTGLSDEDVYHVRALQLGGGGPST